MRIHGRLTCLILAVMSGLFTGCDSEGSRFESSTNDAIFPWPARVSPIPPGSYPDARFFEDFTGDGPKDSLVQDGDGNLIVYIQTSPGRFSPGPAHDLESEVGLDPAILAVIDLPGDSSPAPVAGGPIQASSLMNLGQGRFPAVRGSSALPADPGRWGNGDLDADGRREALVTDANLTVRSLSFSSVGAFLNQPLVSLNQTFATQPQGLDLDGDQSLELVLTVGRFENPAFIFRRDSQGIWLEQGSVGSNLPSTFSDLDSDGDQDLISTLLGILRWRENQAGTFAEEVVLASFNQGVGQPIEDPISGDWDGNGLMDVLSPTTGEVFLQLPNFEFTRTSIPTMGGPGALDDLDHDGTVDLITFDYDSIQALSNQDSIPPDILAANATFRRVDSAELGSGLIPGLVVTRIGDTGLQSRIETYAYAEGGLRMVSGQNLDSSTPDILLAVRDFNGDRISDLLVITPTGDLGVHVGLSSVGFAETPIASPIFASRPLGVGDIDGDGDLDLVSAPGSAIFLNDGNAGFQSAPGPNFNPWITFHQANFQYDIRDYDRDGITDIVYLASRSDSPGILARGLGGSPPAFGPTEPLRPLTTAEQPRRWTLFDMDQDGDPDFLERVEGFWLENLGPNLATGPRILLPPSLRNSELYPADLDGDGRKNDLYVYTGAHYEAWSLTAPGTLSFRHRTTDGPRNHQLYLLDANADGLDDLLTLSIFELRLLLNSGRLNRH